MKSGSYVAINIFVGDKIINKNKTPIIYYWDGKTIDVSEALQNSKEFMQFITKEIINSKNYGDAVISYCFFDNTENYTDKTEMIQTWLPIAFQNNLVEELIKGYFNYLYKCSYQEDYIFEDIFEKDIINIYDMIKDKYPQKIAKSTVINYVRSQLQQVNHINTDNTNVIIDKLEKILTNKE